MQRAKESIDNLHKEIIDFLHGDSAPYKIVGRSQNGGLEYALVAFGEPQAPLRFAVLAGEIIHHLRSSLDHLIYALVIYNGGTPSNKNQFPICSTAKQFEGACSRGLINGVSVSAKKLIIAAQPYTTPTPDDTILYVVNQYDNIDKHRLLAIVTTIVKLGEKITIGSDAEIATTLSRQGKGPCIIGLEDPSPSKISKDGAEVFIFRFDEPAPEFVANAELVPDLVFEEFGRNKFSSVIPALVGLFKGTKGTIETFSGEFGLVFSDYAF
jgi:hypothetical protein